MNDTQTRQERFEAWTESVNEASAFSAAFTNELDIFSVLSANIDDRRVSRPDSGLELDAPSGDIATTVQLLQSRKISCVELVKTSLARLYSVKDRFNAVVSIDEERALKDAQSMDNGLFRTEGSNNLSLPGIPLAHKDMFYWHSRIAECGSNLGDLLLPQPPSTALARLAAAGTVNLGALHMTEIAFDPSGCNPLKGDCLNPWHPDFIPGGSSSGSAVAVATGAVFAALGSDTGGSIRLPAALCGVTGLKPTYGRVTRHGSMALSDSHDHIGPLANSVRDCAHIFSVISGPDSFDRSTLFTPLAVPFVNAIDTAKGIRIGVDVGFFHEGLDPEIARLIERSLQVFRDGGAIIVEVPEFPYNLVNEIAAMMIRVEAGLLHNRGLKQYRNRFSPPLIARLEAAQGFPIEIYRRAAALRGKLLELFLKTVMVNVDVLHLPILRMPTPRRSVAGGGEEAAFEIGAELTRLTRPINYLGLPALALPCGFHGVEKSHRMPTGFQLVGRPYDEDFLFKLGEYYQRATNWSDGRSVVEVV